MSLADAYHDENGRPLPPPEKSPRVISPAKLQPWQEQLRERATARAEARALGPLANTPQARAAFHRNEQIKAKGRAAARAAEPPVDLSAAEADNPAEIRAPINTAFALPPPGPAAAPERPRAADLAGDEEAVAATLAKYATQTTVDPKPAAAATPILSQSPEEADKSERRREGARKAAATVRARREQREHDAEVKNMMEKRLDSIGLTVMTRQANERADAEQAAADPGIPTYRSILATARTANAEAELFRLAHIARAPRQPADWSPAIRQQLSASLNQSITDRQNAKPKGARK